MRSRKRGVVQMHFLVAVSTLIVFSLLGCGGGGGGSGSSSGGSPEIALSATQFDFGNIPIGTASDRSIQVQNLGTGPLSLHGTVPTGAFSIYQSDCPQNLAPGGACTINLRFTPVAQTPYTSSFTLTTNDSDEGTVTVPLSGTGKDYNVVINAISSSCPNLQVLVTVTAGAAKSPVVGLSADKFSVTENGTAIPVFNLTTPGTPISVGMVMDYSTSMTSLKTDIQNAAKDFITNLQATDEAEVIKFNNAVTLVQPYTSNKATLNSAIDSAYTNAQGTRVFDAVKASIDDTRLRSNLKLAVIVLSDFNDNSSIISLDQIIAYAQDYGVPVFTIGIGGTGDPVDTVTMQRLAVETGGLYYLSPDAAGLQAIYTAIRTVLSSQYLIEYSTPSNGTGSAADPVVIDIQIHDNGHLGEDSRDGLGC